jgi:hypothetical protein
MPSGDLCKRSTPRVELDQRARDACLGLERIERLLAQRAGPMMPAQAEASSSWLWHTRRKAAAYLEFSGENLIAVLAEGRRGDRHRPRRVGEFDRLR